MKRRDAIAITAAMMLGLTAAALAGEATTQPAGDGGGMMIPADSSASPGSAMDAGAGSEKSVGVQMPPEMNDSTSNNPASASGEPAQTPATRPQRQAAQGNRGRGPMQIITRLREALVQLDLSDDEKSRANAVLDQAQEDANNVQAELNAAAPRDRVAMLRTFAQGLRQQLGDVLSPQEMQQLRQAFTGQGAGAQPGQPLARYYAMKAAIRTLDLSADQKQKVKDILAKMDQRIAAIRQSAAAGEDVQEDVQALRRDLRKELMQTLTPEQQQQLMDAIQQSSAGNARNTAAAGDADIPASSSPPPDHVGLFEPDQGAKVGAPAPPFHLTLLSGAAVDLSHFKGHVVVLEFGSLSAPTFRQHVQQMEQLRQEFTGRAWFMIVYTREAYPAGDSELRRNKDDGISVDQPDNLQQRKTDAADAQRRLNITMPIAVDDMDDDTARAYGGFPNGTIVIGKDGKIAARERWTNPDELREILQRVTE